MNEVGIQSITLYKIAETTSVKKIEIELKDNQEVINFEIMNQHVYFLAKGSDQKDFSVYISDKIAFQKEPKIIGS